MHEHRGIHSVGPDRGAAVISRRNRKLRLGRYQLVSDIPADEYVVVVIGFGSGSKVEYAGDSLDAVILMAVGFAPVYTDAAADSGFESYIRGQLVEFGRVYNRPCHLAGGIFGVPTVVPISRIYRHLRRGRELGVLGQDIPIRVRLGVTVVDFERDGVIIEREVGQ